MRGRSRMQPFTLLIYWVNRDCLYYFSIVALPAYAVVDNIYVKCYSYLQSM
jgi:hypothetical protein